jgi:multidrug resistance efflux pump
MTRPRIPRLLPWLSGLLLVAVTLTGAQWITGRSSILPASNGPDAADGDGRVVVCFGHADLEAGVTPLRPTQPGRVAELLVREGDRVAAGAPLLRLDEAVARGRLEEAEAARTAAQAQRDQSRKLPEQHRLQLAQQEAALDAARHRLAAARLRLERLKQLSEAVGGKANSQEIDAGREDIAALADAEKVETDRLAELKLNDPTVAVRRADAEAAAAEARVQQAKGLLAEHTLTAPITGTVLRLSAAVGGLAGPQSPRPAVDLCPDGPRLVRAEVEQAFASRVAVGQVAVIEDDVQAGASWRGRVRHLSDWYTHQRSVLQEPLQFNDVRTLECLVDLDPGQPPLRIGQRVRVRIEISGR